MHLVVVVKKNLWKHEGFANVSFGSVESIGKTNALSGCHEEKPMETRRICQCKLWKCQISWGNQCI